MLPCRPVADAPSEPPGAESESCFDCDGRRDTPQANPPSAPRRLAAVSSNLAVHELDDDSDTQQRKEDVTSPTVPVNASARASLTEAFDRPELDRYELEEQVGAGGMSVVYAARDVELDRRVALKVMRLDVGEPKEEQVLLAEARSLAGLNHPNVVPVYDVGYDREGRLYMAMELVRGKNFRAWLDASERSVSEILDVLVAAGRGLASAHAVELVHCDFKPTNILVGEDGRVRVVDFGIARRVFRSETQTGATGTGSSSDDILPPKRLIVGTPRYMSPEQMRGEPVTPSTDQFSFCLTLYEALYGQVPFLGRRSKQKVRNILAGNVRPPPRGSLVSKRIHSVILRGLLGDAEARWPSMDELLRALSRGGSRPRAVGGLVVAGLVGSGVALAAVVPVADPCASTQEEAASVWNADRREQLRDAFHASGISNPDAEHARLDAKLSSFADEWSASRVRVCEAANAAPERRAAQRTCLYRALEQFSVLVEVVATGDALTLRNSPEAVSALPNIASCDAAAPDKHATAPPEIRDRVESLAEELSTIPPLLGLHRYERADDVTARVLHEAELLDFAPLLAEAQYRRADLLDAQGLRVDAAKLLDQAFHTAQTAHQDRLAARIAVELHLTYGYRLARPKLAERWERLAQAAVERLGDDAGSLRAEHIRTVGLVALRNTNYELARERFRETLALYESLENPDPLLHAEAQSNFGIACLELGELDAAETAFQSAMDKTELEVGRFNNRHISIINNLGNLEQMRGDHQASHDYFRRVYETEVALYGTDDIRVAMSLNNMGTSLLSLNKDAEAIVLFERSIRAYESGDHHGVDLARPVGNLGVAHMRADNFDKAEANLVQAIALIEAELGPMQADSSGHWFNLGSVRLRQGEHERALDAMRRSLEIDEHALGRNHPFVAQTLSAIGVAHIKIGEPKRARALLEESVEIFAAFDIDPLTVNATRFELAKLMWDQDERDGARELIEEVEVVFAEANDVGAPELSQLRAWKKSVSY
ncbi:MAG: serine/threonine-protein kinase [Nannocystales bacterium]